MRRFQQLQAAWPHPCDRQALDRGMMKKLFGRVGTRAAKAAEDLPRAKSMLRVTVHIIAVAQGFWDNQRRRPLARPILVSE